MHNTFQDKSKPTERGHPFTTLTSLSPLATLSSLPPFISPLVLLLLTYIFALPFLAASISPCNTTSTTQTSTQIQKLKSTSMQAMSSALELVAVQPNPPSISFLDLPLEVRILIYTEVMTRPENHYVIDGIHLRAELPAILRARPQMTREIHQFCTITAVFKNTIAWELGSSIFAFMAKKLIVKIAEKLIKFNAQKSHKGAVLIIMLRCWAADCRQGDCCKPCKAYAEHAYILPMNAMGLEKRLITLV
jgi:hypothetical protein